MRLRTGFGLAAFLLVGVAAGAEARALWIPTEREGSWLAPDRQLHFAGSLAVAASLRVEGRPTGTAVGITVGAGVLKEAYDAWIRPARPGRGASRKDLVADLAGAAAGVLILGLADR